MINKLNEHYSMTNPASIYDEEALTALELAGRTAAKTNECVESFNQLESDTTSRLKAQDEAIPSVINETIQKHITNGTFDKQIDTHMGNIESEINQKLDKRGEGVVNLTHLSQEVKEAMTGGSVAVVGVNSLTNENLKADSVRPENMQGVNVCKQLLDTANFTLGKYWNKDTMGDDQSSGVFAPIRVYTGETLYYSYLRGYFCYIKYDDEDTYNKFSETDVQSLWGNITIEKDGYLYVTVNKTYLNNAKVTNYRLYRNSVNTGKYVAYQFENLYQTLSEFRTLARTDFSREGGENLNGGVVSGNTITIPTAYTGKNTYKHYVLDSRFGGKRCTLCMNFSIDDKSNTFSDDATISCNIYGSGTAVPIEKEMHVREKDGSLTVFLTLTIPDKGAQLYYQISNSNVLDGDVTITFNHVCYLVEDHVQNIVGDINKMRESAYGVNSVTVDVNGGGDYTGLRECFDAIKSLSTEFNRYNVYVKAGTYNVRSYYTEEEWNKADFKGLFVPDWVTLIGVGNREEVIITAECDEGRELLSTLNLYNSAGLENLTVIGTKTRYAVHDDFANPSQIEYKRTVKNCVFIGNETYYNNTFGTGTKQGAKWVFENCLFINNGTGPAFSNHNNVNFERPCFITFRNCRFKTNGDYAVRLGTLNNNANGILTYVTFEGCKMECLYTGLLISEENKNMYGAGILFKVSGYANKGVTHTIINTDGKNYADYIDLI